MLFAAALAHDVAKSLEETRFERRLFETAHTQAVASFVTVFGSRSFVVRRATSAIARLPW